MRQILGKNNDKKRYQTDKTNIKLYVQLSQTTQQKI